LGAIADSLADWSRRSGVVEEALARYRAWLAESGRHVIAEAALWDQALVFRGPGEAFRPQVVTRFALSTLGGLAPAGTLEVYTNLDGSPAGLSVTLDPVGERSGGGRAEEGGVPY
jgi:hypothetical protein